MHYPIKHRADIARILAAMVLLSFMLMAVPSWAVSAGDSAASIALLAQESCDDNVPCLLDDNPDFDFLPYAFCRTPQLTSAFNGWQGSDSKRPVHHYFWPQHSRAPPLHLFKT